MKVTPSPFESLMKKQQDKARQGPGTNNPAPNTGAATGTEFEWEYVQQGGGTRLERRDDWRGGRGEPYSALLPIEAHTQQQRRFRPEIQRRVAQIGTSSPCCFLFPSWEALLVPFSPASPYFQVSAQLWILNVHSLFVHSQFDSPA